MSKAQPDTSLPTLDVGLEVALELGADIGEGPIWDEETSTLLFVDSTRGWVYRLDPASGKLTSFDAGQDIGVAIPRERGGLVISSRDGLLATDCSNRTRMLVPIEQEIETHRMNDAKCDSRGRLWSGTFSLEFVRKAGALYRVDPDLTVTRVVDEISVSNGIAWSPDETRMYYVDTIARGVDVFDYDIETGAATNRRQFAPIERAHGIPDGITIDAEGYLWVAMYLGSAVRRYAPSGECVGQIILPVSQVTSCGFGGPDLGDLYITTARHGMSDEDIEGAPLSGALFRCRPGVKGLPTCRFAG